MYQHQHTLLPLEELEGAPTGRYSTCDTATKRSGAALPDRSRIAEGDADDGAGYEPWTHNY